MKKKLPTKKINQNIDFRNLSKAELHRRFIDLQFKRSELEKQLKRINQILFDLGREMEDKFSYDQLYKYDQRNI